ncbi:MAG: cupin domain-containing protein [Polyangiaceae bacterium]
MPLHLKFSTPSRLRKACAGLGLGVLLSGAFAAQRAFAAPMPVATELMTKALGNIPGKEALLLTVVYPPGGVDPIHRHDAHGFIYVLEGSIVMGVKGGKEVTLSPGQTFYESPTDIHTVGRNASTTQRAKFLVLLIKDQGVPAVLPAP